MILLGRPPPIVTGTLTVRMYRGNRLRARRFVVASRRNIFLRLHKLVELRLKSIIPVFEPVILLLQGVYVALLHPKFGLELLHKVLHFGNHFAHLLFHDWVFCQRILHHFDRLDVSFAAILLRFL